jgi:hypothetical protein
MTILSEIIVALTIASGLVSFTDGAATALMRGTPRRVHVDVQPLVSKSFVVPEVFYADLVLDQIVVPTDAIQEK